MTRSDIAAVIAQVPRLAYFGVNVRLDDSEGFIREQEQLLGASEICARCCQWLKDRQKVKKPKVSSYRLKHLAEQEIGEYVPNGVMIAAAIHCGFTFKVEPGSPNVAIGISEAEMKDLAHA